MHYFMKYELNTENVVRFLNEFQCQRCKPSCCQRLAHAEGIALKQGESKELAYNLGMSHNQFKGKYTFTREGRRLMNVPCPFHSEEINGCTIHNIRPQVCRQFPFNRSIDTNGKKYMTVCVDCAGGKLIGEKYGVIPESVGIKV